MDLMLFSGLVHTVFVERTEINSFGVIDCSTGAFYELRATRSIENLGRVQLLVFEVPEM